MMITWGTTTVEKSAICQHIIHTDKFDTIWQDRRRDGKGPEVLREDLDRNAAPSEDIGLYVLHDGRLHRAHAAPVGQQPAQSFQIHYVWGETTKNREYS